MINKIFKRIFDRYSNIFKFLFYIKYLFLIFFIASLTFLLIPKFFDYEKKRIYLKNYLNKNYNLVAFGGRPFCKKEITLINELGLSKENVIYKSGDDNILRGLYKRASLFVYPSLYEGFGLPPLEAMSCGCPVVCSNSSSMPEVVGNTATYFDPKSLDSIYIAIVKTLNDKQKIEQLKIKGFKRIKNFEWAKCAKMTLDIYGNLIK